MKKASPLILLSCITLLSSCGMFHQHKPLRERLQGEWLVTKRVTTEYDSLGNRTGKAHIGLQEPHERDFSIYTFQDTIVDIKTLKQPSAFPYKLKEGEGAAQDSILAFTFTRDHPAMRIGVTFPEEGRMKWHLRTSISTQTNPKIYIEETTEFRRVKVNQMQNSLPP